MKLSNMEIAMLSPVKRKVYLRRQERNRQRILERIILVPFLHPVNGNIFLASQARILAVQREYAKLESYYDRYRQQVEAEFGGES